MKSWAWPTTQDVACPLEGPRRWETMTRQRHRGLQWTVPAPVLTQELKPKGFRGATRRVCPLGLVNKGSGARHGPAVTSGPVSKGGQGLEICWLVSLEKTVQGFQDPVASPWGRAGGEGGEDVTSEPRPARAFRGLLGALGLVGDVEDRASRGREGAQVDRSRGPAERVSASCSGGAWSTLRPGQALRVLPVGRGGRWREGH